MMVANSIESQTFSMTSVIYHQNPDMIISNNVNLTDYCQPSTSYHEYASKTLSKPKFSYSLPSRIQGSSRDAIGFIYSRDDFSFVEHLGEGFFGHVYKVRSHVDNTDLPKMLVMKIAKLSDEDCDTARLSAKRSVAKEASVLLKLKHENILEFYGLCIDRKNTNWSLHLLIEYCDRGSLQSLILSTDKDFPWLERCLIALDVSNAMSFVNSRGLMHRDLTSMNVLLKSISTMPFARAVVADFGLSSEIPKKNERSQQVGTQNYMSPEMLLEKEYNEKSDVFSFGIILCQMIARIDADHDAGLYRTRNFGIHFTKFIEKCPNNTPILFLELAFMCCKYDPSLRPSFFTINSKLHYLVNDDLKKWDKLVEDELFSCVNEVRFGRSHSDAAIRAENFIYNSNNNNHIKTIKTPTTIPEGVEVDYIQTAALFKIAKSFADEESDDYSKNPNPFHNDARIRSSCRKIKPSDSFNKKRFIKSPTIDTKLVIPFITKTPTTLKKNEINRSYSIPSNLNLSDMIETNSIIHLPMDSNSTCLRKISRTFDLGRTISPIAMSPDGKSNDNGKVNVENDIYNFKEIDDIVENDLCETSDESATIPIEKKRSYENLQKTEETLNSRCHYSWPYIEKTTTSVKHVETVVKQIRQGRSKRKICSFVSYAEEIPYNGFKTKDTCTIF